VGKPEDLVPFSVLDVPEHVLPLIDKEQEELTRLKKGTRLRRTAK